MSPRGETDCEEYRKPDGRIKWLRMLGLLESKCGQLRPKARTTGIESWGRPGHLMGCCVSVDVAYLVCCYYYKPYVWLDWEWVNFVSFSPNLFHGIALSVWVLEAAAAACCRGLCLWPVCHLDCNLLSLSANNFVVGHFNFCQFLSRTALYRHLSVKL